MTKEELKDKAEEKSIEYVDNLKSASVFSDGLSYTWEQITNAYIQGALDFTEPKEKRITELEAQIEKMKCCGNCKHFKFRGTSMNGFYTCMKDGENKGIYYRSCVHNEKWEI